MSSWRAIAIVALVAVAGAVAVALVSRTPANVRNADPGRSATDPSLGPTFTDMQVARHAAFRGPGYLALAVTLVTQIVVLLVLARGPFGRLVGAVERLPGGILVHAAAAGIVIAAIVTMALLPVGFVRGFIVARDWGLSTQGFGGWVGDTVRGTLVGSVTSGIAAAAFFGIVRWKPGSWWVWGWAGFTVLTAALVFLWPVAIAPLFNRFTPLEDAALAARIKTMALREGVEVDDVLVSDASRRTTAENAYVAGLGGTKRMVLYDTLVERGGEDETLFVAAHELGHEAEGHVLKGVLVSSIGLLLGFGALTLIARTLPGLWSWGGASGVGDLRALPLLLLFALAAGAVALPVENALSRNQEATADRIALRLTDDPDTAVRVFRRLAFSNLADLRPPAVATLLLYTHPPIDERIRNAIKFAPAAPRG
ncbi:MAG: M48 family metallopeptidase [Actinomycetota bacterium]|nr:M48 family metallopeptidase [Actinomycetota bacterium]